MDKIKSRRANFILRKNGDSRNVSVVVGDVFDASVLVDCVRSLMSSNVADYLLIEPESTFQMDIPF